MNDLFIFSRMEMTHKYLKMLNGFKQIQFVCYKCQRDEF